MRIALSIFIGLLALTFASVADARPRHKGHHYAKGHGYYAKVRVRQVAYPASVECSQYGCSQAERPQAYPRAKRWAKVAKRIKAPIRYAGVSPGLAGKARAYIGTNPTGWRSLWCGRFMAMVAPEAAARISNPNAARSWAELPGISAQVGAIAVMGRGRCRNGFCPGHVGVVSGFQNGNPIIISGNNAGRVREAPYPASGVIKYVSG